MTRTSLTDSWLGVTTAAPPKVRLFTLVPSIWRVPLLYAVAFFIAIGQGLCYPALTSLVSKVAPESERGSILGLATSVGSLARFLGPILSGFLYDLAKVAGAFYGGAVLMIGALVIAMRMRDERPPAAGAAGPEPR